MSSTKYRTVGVVRRSVWSTACIRRRSASANSARGSTGTIGNRRRSSGSAAMVVFLLILAAQCRARARQERFGAVHAASEVLGNRRDGQAVQITQRQRRAL